MPRNGWNPCVTIPPNWNGINALSRFSMEDLQAVPATTGLIACTAQESPDKAPAYSADGPAVITRHGAPTDPVCCVPKGYEGVAAADGKVPACWS